MTKLDEIHFDAGDTWCAYCSRAVKAFGGKCPKCGTPTEELGTGDDAPYPEEEA